MDKPVFSGLFSDDVRQEVMGKYSLMGCFGTHMYLPTLPCRIKGLCFSFDLKLPVEYASSVSTLVVTVKANQKDLVSITTELEFLNADPRTPYVQFSGGFELPLRGEITEPTILEAEAHINGTIIEGPLLIIEVNEALFTP